MYQDAIFDKENVGIYRDDGLALIKLSEGGRITEKEIKPKLNALFNSEGLEITVDPASQLTDYFEVKFNLNNHTHEPYRKPNDNPCYLNVNSEAHN